ncbi:MAG TPA: hypothetical protein VFT88_05155 [Acidobacteriaceae bacterium]|nr:hypothetical protein [Acidobacteriaceae bacterium]
MADEPETEPEIEAAEESPETWVSDGELWIADAKALCAEFGILAIATYEGNPVAYIRGKGAVALSDVFKQAKPKGAAQLRSIKK